MRNRPSWIALPKGLAVPLFVGFAVLASSGSPRAQVDAEIAHYRRVIEVRPDDVQAHMSYQDALLKADRRSTLLREYRSRLKRNPANGLSNFLYARLLADLNDALPYLKLAVDIDPSIDQARLELGRGYYHKGNYDSAITQYSRYLASHPKSAFARNLLGLAYYHKGYPNQAVAEYQRAIGLNEGYTDAYLNLGLTYYYTGKADEAIKVYESALELEGVEPDRHLIWRNLGMARAQQGRLNQARAAYRKALQIKPDYADAHLSLGNLSFNRSEYGDAAESYEKAITDRAGSSSLNLKLGVSYFNQEEYKKGIRHLRKTVELDSTQTDALFYLGLAAFNDGQRDLSKQAFESYVERERRFSRNSSVFRAKELLDDLRRMKVRDLY